MKRAFTLIELVVSVGVLALVISFSGVVFKISIESYRIAGANAEIMQKLRAITDQLNADFKGIRRDAPLLLWFQQGPAEPNLPNQRYDQIMFFANGDFQSVRLYPYRKSDETIALKTVRGNVGSIRYGQAMDPTILARKQKILTSDDSLIGSPSLNDPNEFLNRSLAEWKVISNDGANNAQIILTCDNANRPHIDLVTMSGVHMLMAQQVSSFSIQWAYFAPEGLRWFPTDLDFEGMEPAEFGIYFNMPDPLINPVPGWSAAGPGFFPEALRFTFTLYDSRGILGGGRTFTHIVHLGN